jgi:hypothetical protein
MDLDSVLVILALVGIVSIITRSYILQILRDKAPTSQLRYMLNCPQCTGFWVGIIYGVYAVLNHNKVVSDISLILLLGGLVSLVASAIIPLLDYLSFAKTVLVNKIANDAESMVSTDVNTQKKED